MNRKIKSLLSSNIHLYLVALVLFAVATFFFGEYTVHLTVAEVAVILLLLIYTRVSGRRRSREMLKYIESVTTNIDSATRNTLQNFPFPMATFTLDENDIIYANEQFLAITGEREHLLAIKISSIVPGFSARWLMEGKVEYPDLVTVGERRYRVFGNLVRGSDTPGVKNFVAATYWVDETEYARIKDEFASSRPVFSIIMMTNPSSSPPSTRSSPSGPRTETGTSPAPTATGTSSFLRSGTFRDMWNPASPFSTPSGSSPPPRGCTPR